MLKLLMKKSLKSVLSFTLIFSIIFCSNSFNNLSRVYAEDTVVNEETIKELTENNIDDEDTEDVGAKLGEPDEVETTSDEENINIVKSEETVGEKVLVEEKLTTDNFDAENKTSKKASSSETQDEDEEENEDIEENEFANYEPEEDDPVGAKYHEPDDNVGATDDTVEATDDTVGATDDPVGAKYHEPADDNVRATDDNVGATDDSVGAQARQALAESDSIASPSVIADDYIDDDTKEAQDDSDESDNIASPSDIADADNDTNLTNPALSTDSEIPNLVSTPVTSTESEITNDAIILEPIVATGSELIIVASYSEIDEVKDYGLILPDYTAPVAATRFEGLFGDAVLEESLDMRDGVNDNGYPVLPEIRDQGQEGFCWAFSTVGLAETYLRKRGYINAAQDARESNLSESALGCFLLKQLKNVTAEGSENIDEPGLEGNDYTTNLLAKKGGNQLEGTLVASSYMGFVVEDDTLQYSNELVDSMYNDTTGIYDKYAFKSNSYELTNARFINKANTDIIKQAIKDNGAVGINYYWGPNSYNSHKHDWKERTDEWFNYTPSSLSYSSNHAVMAVGWDDTIPKEYFTYSGGGLTETPSRDGGWLIRNSWGHNNNYMNDGYFWLSYDDPYLEDTMYSIEVVPADTYKYNYHYDTTAGTKYFPFKQKGNQAANIFRVSDVADQSLDAVSVAFNSANVSVVIKIYTNNNKMSSPIDGTLVSTQDAAFDTAGIYTIPLSNKVSLLKGTYYSIIIESKTTEMGVFVDNTYTASATSNGVVVEARNHVNECENGQSYYGINGNPNYVEVSDDDNINFRIKGLTNEALFIKFNGNGAENIMPSQWIDTPGATVNINDNIFKRVGYTFVGWKDAAGNDYDDKDSITVSASVELIAQWTPVVYRINYNTNGGTIADGTTYFNKTYGVTYPETLKQPTKTGYKFAGWQTDTELTKPYYRNQDVIYVDGTLEYTIHAKWDERTYTITYMNLTDVTWATGYPVTERMYTKAVTLPTADHITRKTDTCIWRFDGWYGNGSYTGDRFYEVPANTAANKTYYAKWTLKQTFKFDLNSHGSGAIDIQYIEPGEKVTKPTDPSDEKWVFEYWYETDEDTEFNFNDAISAPKTTARVLYAKWRPKQEFIFDMNGHGNQVPSQIVDLGGFVTKPADPTAEGWEFLYWYEINKDVEFDFAEVILNVSEVPRTIYARWQPQNYSITYYNEDGSAITGYVDNYDAGSTITLPTLPETDEKVFEGWYSNSSRTGSKVTKIVPADIGDKVFYAKFLAKWSVTFNPGDRGEGTMEVQKIADGRKTALKENAFSRSGYSFAGWEGSDKKTYYDKQEIEIHSDLTLTAMWEKNKGGGGSSGGSGGGGGGGRAIPQQQNQNNNSANSISDVKVEGSLKSIPVNYGTANSNWTQDANGKWSLNIMNEQGQFVEAKNTFACITNFVVDALGQTVAVQDFYFFDANGDMYTGWLRDTENNTYYFETAGADVGKLKHGWAQVNGNYYFFDSEGKMLSNTVTPDGYVVDVEGKWLGQPT